MSIIKRGRCDSKVVTSSSVYVCDQCGHTEMGGTKKSKKCTKCEGRMYLVENEKA